ncbi:MAG: zinc-dependent alcohol dehydrogenase family protein [Simkaniaceae bacterium]
MQAMVLKKKQTPLTLEELPKPKAKENQLLIKVTACGVCRTDLHIKDGELPKPNLPLILGHQIVGIVEEIGKNVANFQKGDRVGVPWLGHSCGNCEFCRKGQENLCENAEYTGYNLQGGFAEYAVCYADFAFSLPQELSDIQTAPLLCAGLIGYRAYRKAAPEQTLGLYGFGSAAHILTQLAIFEGKKVYAFTKDGDHSGQEFAKKLGAVWAGGSSTSPPQLLDSTIIFAPVGELIPRSLEVIKKGGRCICGGIHMSDIPSFPYKDLWGEKRIESVANLTRNDGREFFATAPKIPIQTEVTLYSLEEADKALEDLRQGKFQGSAVIKIADY